MASITLRRPGRVRSGILFGGLLAFSGAVTAQTPAPQPEPPAAFEAQAVSDLGQDGFGEKLANGEVADTQAWPASFRGTFTIDGKPFTCTATLISARALLTAAHCIAPGGTVRLKRANGSDAGSWEGRCERPADGYPQVISADWAMCRMNQPVPAARYERIRLTPPALAVGAPLRVAGFGCTAHDQPPDGVFRIGQLRIAHLPGSFHGHPHWLVSRPGRQTGDAFICKGDSGGPALVELQTGRRLIVAVHSHYDLEGEGVSMLSALWTERGAAFIRDWARRHGEALCGEHDDARNCR